MTREEAMREFRDLIQHHGLQWTARVPKTAWQRLARVNEVLTEADRRQALDEAAQQPTANHTPPR